MMRRTFRLRGKALSPYAQALRQVALKGAVALGPSAKEMELEMYRKGTLPADYRPPVQGKWDDTVERWAYAWQFPAEEDYEDVTASVEKNTSAMNALLDFGDKLLQSPPSAEPRSGRNSTVYQVTATAAEQAFLDGRGVLRQSLLGDGSAEAKYNALEASLEKMATKVAEAGDATEVTASTSAAAITEPAIMPAADYAAQTSIPVAYLDDQSERSNASKELSIVLEGAGLDYTEDGLIVAVAALSHQHHYDQARALFDFARQVGLGPGAELYKALMRHSSSTGDVNQSMALIEEMKEQGITPRIGNWHELMRCFYKARDYPAVSQIVDNMKMYGNIEPNEVTFTLQLRALGKDTSQMNSLAEAVQLMDQMEHVYGYIAARPHYDALMFSLSQSPVPEMRLRCEELAQKMELMGITWNATTYLNLIRSAQVVGDVAAVEKYLARMRDDRVPMNMLHLSWAVQAHVQHVIRLNYEEMKEKNKDEVLSTLLQHMDTCFGIYSLVVQRGWEMQLPFVNALLRLCCQTTILSMEHTSDNAEAIGRFEDQANKIWNDTFDEWQLVKDVYSYECYIALLAHQQRIDEAEKLFQQMVLQEDLVPSRRTYECLIFMHLSSGEEGGAARALRYLEAMENSSIPIRASLLKKIVRVNNAVGYKRDMKRRARRIMQAREEHLARKQAGVGFEAGGMGSCTSSTAPFNVSSDAVTETSGDDAVNAEGNPVLRPLPAPVNSTLAWWEQWKRETVSKHELFEEEGADGSPKGESFAEKNAALKKMGITSSFQSIKDVPGVGKHKLLPALRAHEGEVAGGIWSLDGGELAYPKDGGGPQGWGVRLWRERALIKKEYQKVLDGGAPVPQFSALGNAVRVAGDQLDIEESKASGPGELADWRAYPEHRYEDGSIKPASEMAAAVPASAEYVWRGEQRDVLAAYKSDAELALESDNTFYAQTEQEAQAKTDAVVQVLKNKEENLVEIRGRGTTRRSKHDYLAKWREMYQHGTLEVPEAGPLRFGRSADDHRDSLAASVRDWYARNRKTPASEEQLGRWEREAEREAESRESRAALKRAKRGQRGRQGGAPRSPRSGVSEE